MQRPSKKPKSREVSSRFLSPDYANSILSPLNQKPRSSTDSRRHKSLDSGFLRGLWPSSSLPNPKPDTLADFIGNDRLQERKNKALLLNRQRSCTEFSRFQNSVSAKENHNPGGSMRYTGKFKSSNENEILPGDESRKSFRRGLSDSDDDAPKDFPASYMAPTLSSKKHGIEIPSKFMNDLPSRSRRWSADSKPLSSNSPKKRGAFSAVGLKPPTSPSRGKGVANILSLGIELLKGKKSYSRSSSSLSAENVHQLRLMHNRLLQWRYTNARAESVNDNIIKQAEVCDYMFD